MAEIKKKFDWKITAKKFGIEFVKIFLVGFIAYAQDDIKFIAILPFVNAVLNIIKNYN